MSFLNLEIQKPQFFHSRSVVLKSKAMACHQKSWENQLGNSGQVSECVNTLPYPITLTGNVPLSRAVSLLAPVEQSSHKKYSRRLWLYWVAAR